MLRPGSSLLWPAVACLMSLSVAVPAVATVTPEPPAPADRPAGQDVPGPAPLESEEVQHSSDISEPFSTARAASTGTAWFEVGERTRPVAPGLEHTTFDRYDARGWVRVNALTADLSRRGLRLDYAAAGKVSAPGPLSVALQRDGAVAGVNGDFFDIGDTGAPLGVGADRQRGVLHGSSSGWNNSFVLDRDNVATIAQTYLRASIARKGKPGIAVSNLNAPEIKANGIGIYTPAWGTAARSRVLPSSAARREVVVHAGTGRVLANRRTVSSGQVRNGLLHLVGTGKGALRLAALKVRSRVTVRYGLSRAATKVAVGGSVVVLRDGQVLAPNDIEMHPRTAIGIDKDLGRIIIITADGRQQHSRGLTMTETGALLKAMGAEDGLNLDGGGSSTMLARESGEAVSVVNAPSDGRLRSVPNGLGFSFAKGSGQLRGIRVEPAPDTDDSHRVLRGFSRVLVARGHDETHDPVAARPTWLGDSVVAAQRGPAARTTVIGRSTGTGTVTASAGGAVGELALRVLGPVHRLEAGVSSVALPGKGRSSTFELQGYDAQGFGTWVQPRDVSLSFDRDKLDVRRTGRGFTVTARVPSASDVVTLTAGGKETYVGVTVGLARRLVHGMNALDGFSATAYPARANASLALTSDRHGRARKAVAMRYSLYGARATRAAYLNVVPPKELPARSRRLGLWVRGDGKGAWLRAQVRDAGGSSSTLNLSRRVTWRGWRFVSTSLPSGLAQPVELVRVYAVETDRRRKYAGTLAFDDVTAFTERTVTVPETAALRDPMVTEASGAGGMRVAVIADARFSASAPTSAAVTRLRRTMREVVAAGPNLVVINGDLVGRGSAADMDLARRLITEELDGKVPWRYGPGEGELGAGGDLAAYRAEFGEPLRVLDRSGTRIVMMSSAKGTMRLSGYYQMTRLRTELAAAANDASVHSVVVVAHHPTSDAAAGGTAELADPREAHLVEGLLSGFREDSGKNAAYIGSHARSFGVVRRDGVPHVLAGPVDDPVLSRDGSFSGWTMLRVDPAAGQWLTAEFRPHVDDLRVSAPGTLAVGAVAEAFASVTQAGRRMRVSYPMTAVWPSSSTVHVGAPAGAPPTAVVAYDPGTDRLTALRPGVAELGVRLNGSTASSTVTVR